LIVSAIKVVEVSSALPMKRDDFELEGKAKLSLLVYMSPCTDYPAQ
jgi:hypothetical protein